MAEENKKKLQEFDEKDAIKKELRAILNRLTKDNYELLKDEILEIIKDKIENQEKFLDIFFIKAIKEKSYSEIYAKLCKYLNKVLPQKNPSKKEKGKSTSSVFREQLLAKCRDILKKTNTETLKNLVLTIGIWNSEVDSLYTSVYAFKIFLPPTYYVNKQPQPVELIHIRSDQKVQCDPFEYSENSYACLFAVIFDESDIDSSLIVYPKAQNENVQIVFKGSLVDAGPIEKNDHQYIMTKLDSLGDYSSDDSKFM